MREYHDREEWEFHIRRMHLLHIQHACSVGSTTAALYARLTIDCGQTFSSVPELQEHTFNAHKDVRGVEIGNGKRKFMDENVTPIIQAMPAEVARKHRAVFDGPSRTLSIGQSSKRRK